METKLKEFKFKLIHRTIVTQKELFRFGIKADDECVYCGNRDSIRHSFIECMFTRMFTQKVLNWFDQVNALFGITASSHDTTIIRKFNYTALIMRHYIYSAKFNSLAISFQDFISKLLIKYNLENLS